MMLCDGSVAVNMRVLMQRHTPDSGTAASLMQSFDAGVLRPRGSLLNRSRCPQSASGDVQEHLRRETPLPCQQTPHITHKTLLTTSSNRTSSSLLRPSPPPPSFSVPGDPLSPPSRYSSGFALRVRAVEVPLRG